MKDRLIVSMLFTEDVWPTYTVELTKVTSPLLRMFSTNTLNNYVI